MRAIYPQAAFIEGWVRTGKGFPRGCSGDGGGCTSWEINFRGRTKNSRSAVFNPRPLEVSYYAPAEILTSLRYETTQGTANLHRIHSNRWLNIRAETF